MLGMLGVTQLPAALKLGVDAIGMPLMAGSAQIDDMLFGENLTYEELLALAGSAVAPKGRKSHGFVRVGAGSPSIRVGECAYNAQSIIKMMKRAQTKRVNILLLPELVITGYTAADLFHHEPPRDASLRALEVIRLATRRTFKGVVVVGTIIELEGKIFNVAVAMQGGEYLGIVPKSYLPTYGEFDEKRWFKAGRKFRRTSVILNGREVRMGVDLIFAATDLPGFIFGIEVCEDGWGIIPPHRWQALAGAVLFLNLSASNELVGKDDYRRQMVTSHSAQAIGSYAYASTGDGESTGDIVPGGHCLIAENGGLLGEIEPFAEKDPLLVKDIDVDHLLFERIRNNTYRDQQEEFAESPYMQFQRIPFKSGAVKPPKKLERFVDAYPFVPGDDASRDRRCRMIFKIQVRGLKKRLEHIALSRGGIKAVAERLLSEGKPMVTIGVSGGLDSTLALLVTVKAMDELGISRKLIHGYTMPGFGTTSRTYNNSLKLMELLGITSLTVDIRARCLQAWLDEDYTPFAGSGSPIDLKALRAECQKKVAASLNGGGDLDLTTAMVEAFGERLKELPAGSKDLVFENKQARARTDILMNAGFVIGTGDLSELAVGWCTYNGDHMSMYNVNGSIPKTLVYFLVRWAAQNEFDGELRSVLIDITETEVSPELLPPAKDGKIAQKTNSVIGPHDLRDFYLYHMRRWGSSPEKILYLASQAKFHTAYCEDEIRRWLKVFIVRFFEQRYKHSCLPDSPKVGLSLSPRYDFHMPSDACPDMWLAWAAEI